MQAPVLTETGIRGILSPSKSTLRKLVALAPLWLWAMFPHALPAAADPGAERLPTLSATQAVHRLSVVEAGRHYPVRLRAMVTYYDPYLDYPHRS